MLQDRYSIFYKNHVFYDITEVTEFMHISTILSSTATSHQFAVAEPRISQRVSKNSTTKTLIKK